MTITITSKRRIDTYRAKQFSNGWAFENCLTSGLLSLGGVDQCCQPTLNVLWELTYGRYASQITD